MTKLQTLLYWKTWGQVKKTLIEFGGFSKEEAEAERHQIHIAALGKDKSSKLLNNRDLDTILDHFRSYLVLADGPTKDPKRADVQPCTRLIYAIESTGLPDAYLEAIARDQFGTSEWRKLSEAELTKLRFTAVNRSRKKQPKAS